MSIFVRDTFTDADGVLLQDHTPDVGGSWSRISGQLNVTIEIGANQAVGVGAVGGFGRYLNTAAAVLQDIDLSFSWVAGEPEGSLYHTSLSTGINESRYLWRYETDRYVIRKVYDNQSSLLTSLVEAAPTLPATVVFSFRPAGGPRLLLSVNGAVKLTSLDNTIGRIYQVGVRCRPDERVDDLIATESESTPLVEYVLNLMRRAKRVLPY